MAGNNIIKTTELIQQATAILEANAKALNVGAQAFERYNKSAVLPSEYVNSMRNMEQAQKETVKNLKALEAQQKKNEAQERKMQNARVAELRLQKQREQAFNKYERQLQREEKQLEKTRGLYNRVQQAINKVTKQYQDLALRKQLNGKLSADEEKRLASLQAKLLKYNGALKQVDAQIGRNQRNVGNYASALKGLGGTLRSLASAFGLTSGVFLFAQGVRDAFERIREFDKAMANLSGILGKTRSELKGLQDEIIAVAGSSIKTSNEVADLATALITLGKTESEVIKLLKPTNDLSIALQATSEDAGQLLVGTLNAFQKSADEGQRYADIIAKVRTSSALDFEQIKDALGFIAPAANAAGMSLEQTAAVVGVLADNNIRGQRAGRLMSSSLLRLAADGMTLEDALDQLNQAQEEGASNLEQLALAAELFDAQAAPLGLILSNNRDRLSEFTAELGNANGALEELTEAQLKSLDARLKILDSTWESFLLGLESGENILGSVLVYAIDATSGAIQNLGIVLDFVSNGFETTRLEGTKLIKNFLDVIPVSNRLTEYLSKNAELIIKIEEQLEKNRKAIESQTKAFIDLNGSLAPLTENFENFKEVTKDYFDLLRVEPETVADLRNHISRLNDEIEQSTIYDKEGVEAKQLLIKQYQAQIDALLGTEKAAKKLNTTLKEEQKIRKGSMAFYEKLISTLQDEQKRLATNTVEWGFYQAAIDQANAQLEKIKDTSESVSKALEGTIPFYEEILNKLEAEQKNVSTSRGEWYEYQLQIDRVRRKLQGLKDDFTAMPSASEGTAAGEALLDSIVEGFNNQDDDDGSETFKANWTDTFQTVADIAQQTSGLIGQFSEMAFNRQFADLEASRESALRFAGESAEAQLQIEQQYNERRKEIQRQQAEAQKKQAIFDIVINTASAVVRALGQGGPVLAAIVGALGAAQLALVASQPIPQFWEGGVVGGEQQIMVNDDPYGKKGKNYKEVIERPNGKISMPTGKNVKMTVPKGTIVHPTYDAFMNSLNTELLGNNIMPVGMSDIKPMIVNNGLSKDEIMDVMNIHANKIVNTINNKHGLQINVDDKGFSKYIDNGKARKQILNARFKGSGINV